MPRTNNSEPIPTEDNRAYVSTSNTRMTAAYNYMKWLYRQERGLSRMPADYADFDEWLAGKLASTKEKKR